MTMIDEEVCVQLCRDLCDASMRKDENGIMWASSKTAYTRFRIDTASTPGYITAA